MIERLKEAKAILMECIQELDYQNPPAGVDSESLLRSYEWLIDALEPPLDANLLAKWEKIATQFAEELSITDLFESWERNQTKNWMRQYIEEADDVETD